MYSLSSAQGHAFIEGSLERFCRFGDERVERVGLGVDPVEIGCLVRQLILDLVIEDHAPFARVDDKHLTGP